MTAPELLDLPALKVRIEQLGERISAPETYLPSYGHSRNEGTPHVEVGETYDWVVSERGHELQRRSTTDLDELLYWVFSTVAYSMTLRIRRKGWLPGQDSRRQWFKLQEDYLAVLSPAWAARQEKEHADILARYPYRDRGAARWLLPLRDFLKLALRRLTHP